MADHRAPMDVYVLANARTISCVNEFLRKFGVSPRPTQDEYLVPEFSDSPKATFATVEALLDWLRLHPRVHHSIYWTCDGPAGETSGLSAHFTTDEALILSVSAYATVEESEAVLARLMSSGLATHGYVTLEAPPPETAAQLIERATVPEHVG